MAPPQPFGSGNCALSISWMCPDQEWRLETAISSQASLLARATPDLTLHAEHRFR
jgi:hypothetical protein